MEQQAIRQCLDEALQHLRQGHCILYPTDTIWGIGCDSTCFEAINRLYEIKHRDPQKSMLILCSTVEMLRQYVESPSPDAIALAVESEKPTTVIFPLAKNLPNNLLAMDGSIGIRIPRMDFCHQLITDLGRPLVSTSANFSGRPSPRSFDEIDSLLVQRMDYCVEDSAQFHQGSTTGSRIVKVEADGSVVVIRS